MESRADRHNNPIACTTEIAKQAKLVEHLDYEIGEPFTVVGDSTYWTARFIHDPIGTSIKVIDAIGYYTKSGRTRWTYIAMPDFVWKGLSTASKMLVIKFHYSHEGGTELLPLWNSKGN